MVPDGETVDVKLETGPNSIVDMVDASILIENLHTTINEEDIVVTILLNPSFPTGFPQYSVSNIELLRRRRSDKYTDDEIVEALKLDWNNNQ